MKVLVAEDSPAHRVVLKRGVEALGHECAVAEDGEAAWALYKANPSEVLISDWVMPGIEGDELCRRVRGSGFPYCYVIMLTALDDPKYVMRGMRAGADDFLLKPFDPAALEPRLAAASRVTELHGAIASEQNDLEALNEELHGQARQDPLTQVGNRLRLQEDLDRHEAVAKRGGPGYAVVMCDIDNFKVLNDHSGHERGDVVLRVVAQGLVEGSRAGDAVYRYGGEELAVVMVNCPGDKMGSAAERIRAHIEGLQLEHPSVDRGVVTISIGVALRSSRNGGAEGTVKRADDALYQAKGAGRNRVVVDPGR